MSNRSIKVIGAGGVGWCLLPTLCRYLNYDKRFSRVEITVIDGDRYVERNRERQPFKKIGNKAKITVDTLSKEFGQISFRAIDEYLVEDNSSSYLRENDIIFCCVDNHAVRKTVAERMLELENAVLISGGNDYSDGNVQIHIRENGKDITVPITEWHPEIDNPQDENPGDVKTERTAGCENEMVAEPQLIIANNMVAATMLNTFYAFLENSIDFEEIYFDCKTCSSRKSKRGKKKKK